MFICGGGAMSRTPALHSQCAVARPGFLFRWNIVFYIKYAKVVPNIVFEETSPRSHLVSITVIYAFWVMRGVFVISDT